MKMKIYLIQLDDWGWDEYDSCVIVAESEAQVRHFCREGFSACRGRGFEITPQQKVENIQCIGTSELYDKPTIICASFNAG